MPITLADLTEFFKWLMLINLGLFIFSVVMIMLLKEFAFKMHSKLFGISRDGFNMAIYCFLGLYKIVFIVFCLTPYLALLIVTR